MKISDEHLKELEDEAIFVMREVAAQFEKKVILFSGGKDSIVLVHLARKAFWPAKMPFSLLHIDTGHNFEETLIFRDDLAKELGVELIVSLVKDSIDQGKVKEETGVNASRNKAQSVTLLDAIEKFNIDVAVGGGRRDEEKARAKERFFSHRNEFGQWDPKNQRPELWNIFNGHKNMGEHFRVFPISNWTELDVWQFTRWYRKAFPRPQAGAPARRAGSAGARTLREALEMALVGGEAEESETEKLRRRFEPRRHREHGDF